MKVTPVPRPADVCVQSHPHVDRHRITRCTGVADRPKTELNITWGNPLTGDVRRFWAVRSALPEFSPPNPASLTLPTCVMLNARSALTRMFRRELIHATRVILQQLQGP